MKDFRLNPVYLIAAFLIIIVCHQLYIVFKFIDYSIIRYKWSDSFYMIYTGFYKNLNEFGPLRAGMTEKDLLKYLTSNLPTSKTCVDSIKEGCWPEISFSNDGNEIDLGGHHSGFILNNGTLVSHIYPIGESCTENDLCNILSIDINGIKGPNKYGHDEFRIYYYQKKVIPYHSSEDKLIGPLVKKFVNLS